MTAVSNSLQNKANLANQFLELWGFTTKQNNGQRVSTNQNLQPPNYDNEQIEVFVGKLPRDLFEDELLPAMERAGRVYKIRLMMDFSGSTRGFAYIQYANPAAASRAVKHFKEIQLRSNVPTSGVMRSFDNKRLYFSNLPPNTTDEGLRSQLAEHLDGVVSVKINDPPSINPTDRKSAFVSFASHEHATRARRVLLPGDVLIGEDKIAVDWAKPKKSRANHSDDEDRSASSGSPTSEPGILGERARQLLEIDIANPFGYMDPTGKHSIMIVNLNTALSLKKLKLIFQLGDQLNVEDIQVVSMSVIKLTYATQEEADLMLETISLSAKSFWKLAIPGHNLLAYRASQAPIDFNLNYQF